MPNEKNNVTTHGKGKVRLILSPKTGAKSYQADLRAIADRLPKDTKPVQTFGEKKHGKKAKQAAIDHCLRWTKEVEDYGKNAQDYWGNFTPTERVRTGSIMEKAKEKHPDLELDEIVELGLKEKLEELDNENIPTLEEYIHKEYLPYREANRPDTQSKQARIKEQNQILRSFDPILEDEDLKSMKLNIAFKPKSRVKKKIETNLRNLTRKDGKNKGKKIANDQLKKKAHYLQALFERAMEDYPEIEHRNPCRKLRAAFETATWKPASIQSIDKVRELFDAAVNPPKRFNKKMNGSDLGSWHNQIAHMALLFFSGCRPKEIRGDHGEDHRIWTWDRMNQWQWNCEISGGLIITVPPTDEQTGLSTSKTRHSTERVLFPSGVEWLKWWCLELKGYNELPNEGDYVASETVWRAIRDHCGVGGQDKEGNDKWSDDARHMVCSSAHRWKRTEKTYWLDHCAHGEDMFNRHYKNPKVDADYAEEYLFNILPPPMEAKKTAEREYESDLLKARNEAYVKHPNLNNDFVRTNGGWEDYEDVVNESGEVERHTVKIREVDYLPDWFKEKYASRIEEQEEEVW